MRKIKLLPLKQNKAGKWRLQQKEAITLNSENGIWPALYKREELTGSRFAPIYLGPHQLAFRHPVIMFVDDTETSRYFAICEM